MMIIDMVHASMKKKNCTPRNIFLKNIVDVFSSKMMTEKQKDFNQNVMRWLMVLQLDLSTNS